jgi:CSLREA domain-containing protein
VNRSPAGSLAVLAIVAWLVATSSATAATFGVTRTDDPAPGACKHRDCSLREAILAANDLPGRDTVVLQGGETYDLEIPGANEDGGLTGDLDVNGRLILKASGGGRATIDAHGLDRVVNVFKRASLVKLKLTGGDVNVGGTGSAGGVEASARVRMVLSASVSNAGAGAALIEGAVVLRSRISNNSGGGISALAGPLELLHSKVNGNYGSNSSGGGVLANQATIDHSKILGNSDAFGCGGAALGGTAPMVTHSVFARNHSDSGGGALCITSNGSATMTIRASRFSENTADGAGGALSLGVIRGTISRVTFDKNEAVGAGGAVHVASSEVTISGSTFSGNQATGVASGSGGAIWADGTGHLKLVNSTVAGNEAAAGGGGIFNSNPGGNAGNVSHVELVFATIAFNNGDSDGLGGDIGGGIMQGMNAEFDDVHGTLIGKNTASADLDCAATVTSLGHNLLTDPVGCTGFDRPSDRLTATPKIGALGSHGGPTQTVPLKMGSPAVGAGGKRCPHTDQRGVVRPQGRRCDIGAFERRS